MLRMVLTVTASIGLLAALVVSCSASGDANFGQAGAAGSGGGSSGTDGEGGSGANGGAGGIVVVPEAGPDDANNDVPTNQCGSACGPEELCDTEHLGYDDNCNGQVDEICSCTPGLSHWCFKGDPASRGKGACKDGVERCSELGVWDTCIGGLHADAVDNCLNQGDPLGCHDLTAQPFSPVNLKDGAGTFGQGATGESFAVQCPTSIPADSCPQVQNPDGPDASFTPLQSGQYMVTYTKDDGAGGKTTCNFSVYVGTGGLRVELNWDHMGEGEQDPVGSEGAGGGGPDIDLHVHRPGFQTPWFNGTFGNVFDDCYYGNCTATSYVPIPGFPFLTTGPNWFADGSYPHNWTYFEPYDPNDTRYTCYNSPRGAGDYWKGYGKGCHNPRLDLDDITCDKSTTNPQDPLFCAPENINIDEPPYGLWTRVGVHYYGHCYAGALHPQVTIYCGGHQVAQFGKVGYSTEITFEASDCNGSGTSGNAFWLVADVMAVMGPCGDIDCVVQPIYKDADSKAPLKIPDDQVMAAFGPPCAPAGDAGPGCL